MTKSGVGGKFLYNVIHITVIMCPQTNGSNPSLPHRVQFFPLDLLFTAGLGVLAFWMASVSGWSHPMLRFIVGIIYIFFVPGYAIVATLFPQKSRPSGKQKNKDITNEVGAGFVQPSVRIGLLERIALSVGTSVISVSIISYLFVFTQTGISKLPVIAALSVFTLAFSILGIIRRLATPAQERFTVLPDGVAETVYAGVFRSTSGVRTGLNILIVVSLLLALGSVSYAAMAPNEEQTFTEFYLLTEDENETLVLSENTRTFSRVESKSLYLGIENMENRPVNYTVVTLLQRVEVSNNTTRTVEERTLNRSQISVPDEGIRRVQQSISLPLTGNQLRLKFLLYKGTPPDDPDSDTAYRKLHLWVSMPGNAP